MDLITTLAKLLDDMAGVYLNTAITDWQEIATRLIERLTEDGWSFSKKDDE